MRQSGKLIECSCHQQRRLKRELRKLGVNPEAHTTVTPALKKFETVLKKVKVLGITGRTRKKYSAVVHLLAQAILQNKRVLALRIEDLIDAYFDRGEKRSLFDAVKSVDVLWVKMDHPPVHSYLPRAIRDILEYRIQGLTVITLEDESILHKANCNIRCVSMV